MSWIAHLGSWWHADDVHGEQPVQFGAVAWLIAALAVSTLGHIALIPWWVLLICLALAIWRLRAAQLGAHGVPRTVRWGLALGLLLLLVFSVGLDRSINHLLPFFVAILWLKLVEVEQRSHLIRVGFLVYFLAAAPLLMNSDLSAFLLAAAGMITTTAALIRAQEFTAPPVTLGSAPSVQVAASAPLRTAWRLLAVALLPAAILFAVMPRPPLTAPTPGRGESGITEQMTPGDMAALALDQTPAFRAQVLSGNLAQSDLWWRALVLSTCNGLKWSRGPLPGVGRFAETGSATETVHVRIDLIPNRERWIPTLDLCTGLERVQGRDDAKLAPLLDGVVQFPSDKSAPRSYVAKAHLTSTLGDYVSLRERAKEILSPVSASTMALANQWRAAGDAHAVCALARTWFAQNGFQYTLQPGEMTGDQLHDFLFEKRSGFCAHFAGAAASLLRLAGIPAHVVVGYRGGELNPMSGAVVVRKSNAHAWVEAWDKDGKRWLRIDPTEAVPLAPGQQPPPGTAGANAPGAPPADSGLIASVQRHARNLFDTVDYHWQRVIVAFDLEAQNQLLAWLGLERWGWWGFALIIAISVALLVLWWWWWSRRRRTRTSQRQRAWQRFCTRLRRHGWPVAVSDGPDRVAQRLETIESEHPGLHDAAQLCRDMATLSYAPRGGGLDERLWRQRARRIAIPSAPQVPQQPWWRLR